MRFALIAGLCLLLPWPGRAAEADYGLIRKLPSRVLAARAASQKGWDSPVTPNMRAATDAYNEALFVMIKELLKAYYPKGPTVSDAEGYLKALYSVGNFRQSMRNPSGEFPGTAASLEVPGEISTELENTIAEMVAAIVEDGAAFNLNDWKAQWAKAMAWTGE